MIDGAARSGSRRRKTSKGGNRGQEASWFVTRYGDLIAADDAAERRRADAAH
jgi:hypothetical protein